MFSSSLNYHSLKAMLLRSTTLTAGRDFRRQGREVGGFCSQTQNAPFLLGFVDGKLLRRFCHTSPVERHTGQRTCHLKERCRCAHVKDKSTASLVSISIPRHTLRPSSTGYGISLQLRHRLHRTSGQMFSGYNFCKQLLFVAEQFQDSFIIEKIMLNYYPPIQLPALHTIFG